VGRRPRGQVQRWVSDPKQKEWPSRVVRSAALRRFRYSDGLEKIKEAVAHRVTAFGPKLAWFIEKGYTPHLYQLAFHTLANDRLLRFRMLVAGRRGGKTLSAAWEVVFYCLHPEVSRYQDKNSGEKDEG
jgi:hypothetical protein